MREREEKRIKELLTRRHQEEIKSRKSIEAIEEIMASEGSRVVNICSGRLRMFKGD